MTIPINNEWVCIVCRRQADSIAVGRPGRLGWLCEECGPERAKDAYMMQREFYKYERRALEKVRAELMEGDLVVPDTELINFLEWLINTFGEKIREELDSGKPPF
ncbi:hypothetical protein [Xanthobacter autotrophicus]|uniref:hypothetical protein n=1 Tax=Xanthobacter autotrophicus TaxID=280 RepID=UPI003726511F